MRIVEVTHVTDVLAEMVALFRVELRSIKGSRQSLTLKRDGREWKSTFPADSPCMLQSSTASTQAMRSAGSRMKRCGGIPLHSGGISPSRGCFRFA